MAENQNASPLENPFRKRGLRFDLFLVICWAASVGTVAGLVWIVVAWYLQWRLTVTVLPADGPWYETAWIWFCFTVEVLAIFDQFILYIAFQKHFIRGLMAGAIK